MKLTVTLALGMSFFLAACSPIEQTSPEASESSRKDIGHHMTETNTPLIKTIESPYSFTETVARVDASIGKRPLNLFAKIDHAAGAAKADLTLEPSTLFIFGNPKGGTPLMARNPQMGIVLPLKMHVYQTSDKVMVSYTDIAAEAESHGLDTEQSPIPNIVKMLEGLAGEVIAP